MEYQQHARDSAVELSLLIIISFEMYMQLQCNGGEIPCLQAISNVFMIFTQV